MSLHKIVIDTGTLTKAGFLSKVNLAAGGKPAAISLANFFEALPSGENSSLLTINTGAVQAVGLITSTGTATNAETMLVCNTTLTAKTSGAVAASGEFNISATVATQATNIAAAINAVSALSGIVTASASLGVVTVTAVNPGVGGNGLQLSESLTNVAITAFASGSNGTSYTLDLR